MSRLTNTGTIPFFADTFMQKTKRLYQDTRTQSNLTKLHEDLQDVTKIMTKNMEDLLYRYAHLQHPFSPEEHQLDPHALFLPSRN